MSEITSDQKAAHSARYILEDLNHPDGYARVAELTGYPIGVISAAFGNLFPPEKARFNEWWGGQFKEPDFSSAAYDAAWKGWRAAKEENS